MQYLDQNQIFLVYYQFQNYQLYHQQVTNCNYIWIFQINNWNTSLLVESVILEQMIFDYLNKLNSFILMQSFLDYQDNLIYSEQQFHNLYLLNDASLPLKLVPDVVLILPDIFVPVGVIDVILDQLLQKEYL